MRLKIEGKDIKTITAELEVEISDGHHIFGGSKGSYSYTLSNVIITLNDGIELEIGYSMDGLTLEHGDYVYCKKIPDNVLEIMTEKRAKIEGKKEWTE